MTIVLIILGLLICGFAALVLIGRRSRLLFSDPSALSDDQIDRMIELTGIIMGRTKPGSSAWLDAAQRNKAALDERLRRRGQGDFSDVEIVPPEPGTR